MTEWQVEWHRIVGLNAMVSWFVARPVSNPFCVILLNWWCKSCDGHLHSCSQLQLSIQSASHLAMVHASQFRAFDLARCHTTESLNLLDCFYPLSRYGPTRHSVDRWLNMQYLTTLPNDNNFATGDTMATLFLNPFLLSPFLPVKTLLEYRMCVMSYMLSPKPQHLHSCHSIPAAVTGRSLMTEVSRSI